MWKDLPHKLVLDVATNPEIDLANLEWKPAERRATTALLGLALRHGAPCSTGLVLDGPTASLEAQAQTIRDAHRKVQDNDRSEFARRNAEQMDSVFPGWKAHGEELQERVDETVQRSIAEADEDLASLLRSPVNDELAAVWVRLGGELPDDSA